MTSSDKQKPVQVLFPCVHGLAKGQFVTINCFPAAELKSSIKVVTGVDEEVAGRVIGASRYGETDSRAGTGVMALFSNPLFSGSSYGLALAIADKLARYPAAAKWKEIYATGAVPADGCGKIDAIQGFKEKLDLLNEHAEPASIFIYPLKNGTSRKQIQEKLEALRNKGIKCIAVDTIDNLQGRIWQVGTHNKVSQQQSKFQLKQLALEGKTLQILSYVVLAGIFSFLIYVAGSAENTDPQTDNGFIHNKSFVSEGKKASSHQVLKYEEQLKDESEAVSRKQIVGSEQLADKNVERNTPILESANTDSSAY